MRSVLARLSAPLRNIAASVSSMAKFGSSDVSTDSPRRL